MHRKLGLRPHRPDPADIHLSSVYEKATELPDSFGATGLDWQMLGNDDFGDCYWASAAHEVMAEASQAGRAPQFDTTHVLNSYAAYLGLYGGTALNEQNDRGTDAREGAKFRRREGVKDRLGRGHKIGAYAFIETPDYELIKSAVYDFEGVTVCVNLPQSAEDAFAAYEEGHTDSITWDYVKGSPVIGGHAIAGVAVKDGKLVVVSWGQEVVMTEAFVEHFLQTVVVYISGSVLDGSGQSPHGLDVAGLKAALAQVA
jgi:hypothetical protein